MIPTTSTFRRSPWLGPEGLRKAIALEQILGGIALSALTFWVQFKAPGLPGWYLLLSQSFAFVFLVAGWLLWRGDRRGLAMSRTLQAFQLLQVYTPWVAWALVAGPHCTVYLGVTGLSAQIGFSGTLTIVVGRLRGWSIGVNLIALAATMLLYRSVPGPKGEVRG